MVPGSVTRREEIVTGRFTICGKRENPMSAGYVLWYRDQKLAVIEAKQVGMEAAEGVVQAKRYARSL